jgi:tRNA(fMet)-specific endonuclease VapC
MATKTALLDSSMLIDCFRKKNKSKSILYILSANYRFCISSITVFEIKIGLKTERQNRDYNILMENIEIFPVDDFCIVEAVKIYKHLKEKNNLVELADLLIGATAISNSLPLASLNEKQFTNFPDIELLSFSSR